MAPNAVATTVAMPLVPHLRPQNVIRRLQKKGADAPDTGVGAAEADEVAQMMVTAREFGFEGDSAPPVGQATRDPVR